MKTNVYIVSHTHWDREWYSTFQEFRYRLVFLIDHLIELMENDPEYKYFHMDGQTIVLEDYLEIRPENRGRLEKLIKDGRIIIGPWFVMPDEFLISGESLVRNLQIGFDICGQYGVKPMNCGYVIDIFGHNNQMPQVFKGFGLETAALFRGAADHPDDMFTWKGADGSEVCCIKLDKNNAYSNFYYMVRRPLEDKEFTDDDVAANMKRAVDSYKRQAMADSLLMMDGVDHIEAEDRMSGWLKIFAERFAGEMNVMHARIDDYIDARRAVWDKLKTVQGELYSVGKEGANNSVIKNVLSSVVQLKHMNDLCERTLTAWVEPLDAFGFAGAYKPDVKGFIDLAWKMLIQNHPHDSICGCSQTRVHEENIHRFTKVQEITSSALAKQFEALGKAVDTSAAAGGRALIIVNGGQVDTDGWAEVEVEVPSGSQSNLRLYDPEGNEVDFQICSVRRGVYRMNPRFNKLISSRTDDYYTLAFKANVPANGYAVYSFDDLRSGQMKQGDYENDAYIPPKRISGSMRTGQTTWNNGVLSVEFTDAGTMNVLNLKTGKQYKNLLVFEDSGDCGDGYHYVPTLNNETYYSRSGRHEFAVVYDGPFSAKWKLTHYMELPESIESSARRSTKMKTLRLETYVTMVKNSGLLDFRTETDNQVIDHRLRVLFASGIETGHFYTNTPFAMVKRPIELPYTGDYAEKETGVFPNQGAALIQGAADSLAVYNRGIYETAVSEDPSHTLALTLYRSVRNEVGRSQGWLSKQLGQLSFEYAVELDDAAHTPAQFLVRAESWRKGTRTVSTDKHRGTLPGSRHSFIKCDGLQGCVISAFRKGKNGMTELRIFNAGGEAQSGSIELGAGATYGSCRRMDFRGEELGNIDMKGSKVYIDIKPFEIVTLGYK